MANSDQGKGKVDAQRGKYNPPSEPLFGLLSSSKDIERTRERKNDYDYGYHKEKSNMKK
ncbi:hypothetical protein [Desulfotignum balticum]|jgi:hypothetical protein|uniref:hypothetical protein n=1 Tax=Desulfotignum balticum TaxID=115781 RepID=UPI000417A230|nr:hypothetical protein [Desulfotignum balticum]